MKYVFEIDVPSFNTMACGLYNEILFTSCCEAISKVKDSVLALSVESYAEIESNLQNRWELLHRLSLLSVDVYDSSVAVPKCVAIPDIVSNIADTNVRLREYDLICHIHKVYPQGNSVFVVRDNRWVIPSSTQLKTIRDKKCVEHSTIVICDEHSFDVFVDKNTPRLVQLKHGAKSYIINGKNVAPFSTYFNEGPDVAEHLLQLAYKEAEMTDDKTFPERLHTWDKYAKTYIEFRQSRDNEYHGFELPEKQWKTNVPLCIREKYHHGL